MGHTKIEPSPIAIDNSMEMGTKNFIINQCRLKEMDMLFYWICDQIAQTHFLVFGQSEAPIQGIITQEITLLKNTIICAQSKYKNNNNPESYQGTAVNFCEGVLIQPILSCLRRLIQVYEGRIQLPHVIIHAPITKIDAHHTHNKLLRTNISTAVFLIGPREVNIFNTI